VLSYRVIVKRQAGLLVAEVPDAPTVFEYATDPMTLDLRIRAAIVAELGLPGGTEETLSVAYEHVPADR